MKRVFSIAMGSAVVAFCALAISTSAHATDAAANQKKAEVKKPADRVIVIYFHRTQRCPTCLRMGSYSEEAVLNGFAEQVKADTVEFRYVDFQDPKNAEMVKAYKIVGPALVVLKIEKNKPVAGENLTEIWAKNRDKEVFLKYVRDNVAAMQKPVAKTAADRVAVIYFHRTQRCPTCLRMGGYSEEAVVKGFAEQIKAGTVEFRYVDFQDPKNAEMVKAFKISGPALVVVKIEKNQPVTGENLTDIWAKNADKEAFFTYVRDHVAAMQKTLPKTAAQKPETNASTPETK